jgi:hypothetical protein
MDLHQLTDAYIPYTLIETRPERLKRNTEATGTNIRFGWKIRPKYSVIEKNKRKKR